MKWTYSIQHKLAAAGLLFMVMLVVLFNNFNERDNSSKVSEAIQTIYDDRLIAERYLFQYLQHAYLILDLLDTHPSEGAKATLQIGGILAKTKELNKAYLKTRLTELEALIFNRLVVDLISIETSLANQDIGSARQSAKDAIFQLEGLSEIQFKEAEKQMSLIQKINHSTAAHFQFEIAVLIIIGLLIQALVFASKSLNAHLQRQNSMYN
jgi:hypothetical protein